MLTDLEATLLIARNLSAILHEKGLTQADLARRTGESTARICHYVKGNRLASAAALARLAEALDVTLDDLVCSRK